MREMLKRELNKTYLILCEEEKEKEERFELEMIMRNSLKTILPLKTMWIDGSLELYYDVTARQTLKECADRVKLSGEVIRKLFLSLEQLLQETKEYLLDIGDVMLDLEHIYTKEGEFFFCYCPWEQKEITVKLRTLIEELMEVLDYNDTESVAITYHFYQSVCKGQFQITELLAEHVSKEETEVRQENDLKYFEEESGMTEESAADETQEKTEKDGILKRVIRFFLKKEVLEDEGDISVIREESPWESFSYENVYKECETSFLEPAHDGTMLLDQMPFYCWKLRPILPGFEEFVITGETFLVGKKRDCVDGFIGRDTISRIHSRLSVKDERLFLSDANSTNGTFVNGRMILPGEEVEICVGDRILFADVGYECYNSL